MASGLISKTQAHSIIVLEKKSDTHIPDIRGFKEKLLPKIYMCTHVCLYRSWGVPMSIFREEIWWCVVQQKCHWISLQRHLQITAPLPLQQPHNLFIPVHLKKRIKKCRRVRLNKRSGDHFVGKCDFLAVSLSWEVTSWKLQHFQHFLHRNKAVGFLRAGHLWRCLHESWVFSSVLATARMLTPLEIPPGECVPILCYCFRCLKFHLRWYLWCGSPQEGEVWRKHCSSLFILCC